MSDQRIYHLLARKPGSRAIDVADFMDVDQRLASEALRELVDIGNVTRTSGIGPNGVQAQIYTLSDDFKATREGIALMASVAQVVEAEPALDSKPVATPALTAHVAANEIPVFSAQTELAPARTKVDRAIEYLRNFKTATDAEMRTAIGMTTKASPRAWLAGPMRMGKIVKVDDLWMLGDGTPPVVVQPPIPKQSDEHTALFGLSGSAQPGSIEPAPDVENVVVVGNLILASKDHLAIAPDVIEAVTRALAPAAPQPVGAVEAPEVIALHDQPLAPAFRCGLWSDDVIELQRDGVEVAKLSRKEGEQMADFLRRMLGEAEALAA